MSPIGNFSFCWRSATGSAITAHKWIKWLNHFDIADCDVSRQLSFATTANALPLLTAKAVRAIWIITPVALDGVRPRAVGICLLGAWPDAITAILGLPCLTILNGLSPACFLVLNYLGKSLFHLRICNAELPSHQ